MPPTSLIVEPTYEELLAQMQDAQAAPEPGTLTTREVLHRGDEELPAPIVASALTSAGYVYVWSTETNERVLCNRNMLPAQLRKTRTLRNGSKVRAFTLTDPGVPPKAGTLKCWLHADNPERDAFDAMGLPECFKSNLPNEFQVELHVKHKHPGAFAALKDRRDRAERDADRADRRALLELATRNAVPSEAPTKGAKKEG